MSERQGIVGSQTGPPSGYRSFADIGDESHLLIHVLPTDYSNSWQQYLYDIDNFFISVYKYHRKSGFTCLVCGQILEIFQFIAFVTLTVFFLNCVDYGILFKNKPITPTELNPYAKVHLYDVIVMPDYLPSVQKFALLLASLYVCWKIGKTYLSIGMNLAINKFYKHELHITDCTALSWQDVQAKLINCKSMQNRETKITELDVSNRILRHTNYIIAMINKGMLPIYFKAPLIGEVTYFTQGFLYNCQLLFFRGPFKCIFEESWKLSNDVKNAAQRQVRAKILERRITILAIINLILSPVILIWLLLYYFYSNAALAKKDPSFFASRNWSLYSRWFCRHYNELDHQLNERLNRGHKPANNYMNSFTSPLGEVVARFVRSIAGSILVILILLTVYDEDVIQVEHLITVVTILTVTVAISHGFICPEIPPKYTKTELHDQIIQHIHYVPNTYPPFTNQARVAMSELFSYKVVKLCEDILSTIASPYILWRHLRPRSLEIIDFFRTHTVEIAELGDVCVFAMMNINENTNQNWESTSFAQQQKSLIESTREGIPINRSVHSNTDPFDVQDNDDPKNKNQSSSFRKTYRPDTGGPSSSNQARDTKRSNNQSSLIDQSNTNNIDDNTLSYYNDLLLMHTEHGKLELSLINFRLQNPSWIPENETQRLSSIDQSRLHTEGTI